MLLKVSASTLSSTTNEYLKFLIYKNSKKPRYVAIKVGLHSASSRFVTYELNNDIPEYLLKLFLWSRI